MSIYEEETAPEFRLRFINWNDRIDAIALSSQLTVTTLQQSFRFKPLNNSILQSTEDIPEPHEFTALINYKEEIHRVEFKESDDNDDHHNMTELDADHLVLSDNKREKYDIDNNFRAAVLHVTADAFVAIITIIAIAIAGTVNGTWFLNPVAGIFGSLVIISWALQLIRDTTGTLLDMTPNPSLNSKMRSLLESDNQTTVVDLHLWKLGPGKLGVIVSLLSVVAGRTRQYYWNKLKNIKPLAHTTIEIFYSLPSEDVLLPDHNHDHSHSTRYESSSRYLDCGHEDHGFDHEHHHAHESSLTGMVFNDDPRKDEIGLAPFEII